MNRRKFFKAAASFVAGCAIGIGMKPKIEPIRHVLTPDYEYMVFFDKDIKHVEFASSDGVRSITYKCIDGKWEAHESTRKA